MVRDNVCAKKWPAVKPKASKTFNDYTENLIVNDRT